MCPFLLFFCSLSIPSFLSLTITLFSSSCSAGPVLGLIFLINLKNNSLNRSVSTLTAHLNRSTLTIAHLFHFLPTSCSVSCTIVFYQQVYHQVMLCDLWTCLYFLCSRRLSLPANSTSVSKKSFGGSKMWWRPSINTKPREMQSTVWASMDPRPTSASTKPRWSTTKRKHQRNKQFTWLYTSIKRKVTDNFDKWWCC